MKRQMAPFRCHICGGGGATSYSLVQGGRHQFNGRPTSKSVGSVHLCDACLATLLSMREPHA